MISEIKGAEETPPPDFAVEEASDDRFLGFLGRPG